MSTLAVLQIIVSVFLVASILLQQKDSEVSGFLGGGGGSGGAYQQRRGLDRILFYSTIVLTVIFAVLAIMNLFATDAQQSVDISDLLSSTSTPSGTVSATSTSGSDVLGF